METILITEDDKVLQTALNSALKKEGYNVVQAFNGQECLNKVKENKPDLILLDIIMPRMNGMTALKILQEDDTTKDIPVMILTNLNDVPQVINVVEFEELDTEKTTPDLDSGEDPSKMLSAYLQNRFDSPNVGFFVKSDFKIADIIKAVRKMLNK